MQWIAGWLGGCVDGWKDGWIEKRMDADDIIRKVGMPTRRGNSLKKLGVFALNTRMPTERVTPSTQSLIFPRNLSALTRP